MRFAFEKKRFHTTDRTQSNRTRQKKEIIIDDMNQMFQPSVSRDQWSETFKTSFSFRRPIRRPISEEDGRKMWRFF